MSEPNTNIRSYEVSVWTLQDSFLAVLKWSELGVKGTIQEPKLTLNSDGTQNFSFTIPMKLYIEGEWRDNPIWYNTTNGNLLANMRKIKVIFNKKTTDEEVYEFLITKMTMKHAQDSPTCEVNCENGLAYHELGKQGYKLELSSAVFYDKDLQEFKKTGESITADLKYWCEEQLNLPEVPLTNQNEIDIDKIDPRKWYYKIEMDWSSFSSSSNRQSNQVYEESYVSSWVTEGDKAVVAKIEDAKVKERLIDEQNSNLYNLTQSLATKFNVYCRYQYLYDNNYHIRARIIIFYNNFLNDDPEKLFQFQYPYSTTEVSREVDGTDIVTKMYIDTIESNTATGVLSIMNSDANKMREDYLLNFDYMYGDAQGITEEQYEAIADYESQIKELNDLIIPLQEEQAALENLRVDVDAKLAVEKNAKTLADAEISTIDALLINLTDGKGVIDKNEDNPDIVGVMESDKKGKYVHITNKGIKSKIKAYYNYNIAAEEGQDKLSGVCSFGQTEQEDGTIILDHLKPVDKIDVSKPLYLTYTYEPQVYQKKVKEDYMSRSAAAEEKINQYTQQLADIDSRLGTIFDTLSARLEQKKLLVADFELMMGPALREGHWTPEDYSNYGNKYIEQFTFGNTEQNYVQAIWDDKLFPEEQHIYYYEGINQTQVRYPILLVSGYTGGPTREQLWTNILNTLKNGNNINLVFYDGPEDGQQQPRLDSNYKIIPLGAGLELVFVNRTYTYQPDPQEPAVERTDFRPAFIVTEAANLSSQEINLINNSGRLAVVTWEEDTDNTASNDVSTNENNEIDNDTSNDNSDESTEIMKDMHLNIVDIVPHAGLPCWLNTDTDSTFTQLIPRIKISSLDLMTSEDKLAVRYNNQLLEEYKDYSLLLYSPEDNNINASNINSYCITIKSLPLLLIGSTYKNEQEEEYILYKDTGASNTFTQNFLLHYYIANASTSIYLDALTILKENAFPKVSYSLTPNIINMDIHKRLYSFLTRIVNINDIELKLHEAYGYISEIELDLDQPWNDTITVQNYKNKFEDIFSIITVQSEEMQRREYQLNETVQLVDVVTKEVNPEMLQKTISTSMLDYDFNAGTLIFTENEGITGLSDQGIITMRGSGIFTATEKDADGNWIWNNAILPSGINAALIKAGQLDTQKIMIYSGNDVKFQWNSNGIYAYKTDYRITSSASSNTDESSEEQQQEQDQGTADQYVLFNEDGLSLVREDWKQNNNDDPVKQVEVSWNGFILRNNQNIDVFKADPNGNLEITGIIKAQAGGEIGGWHITNNQIYSTTYQEESNIQGKYVVLSSDTSSEYCIAAGMHSNSINAFDSAPFSVKFDGAMKATNGEIGGWKIGQKNLYDNNSRIILRSSQESNTTPGSGQIGIFTNAEAQAINYITYLNEDYYLYTTSRMINNKNEYYYKGYLEEPKEFISKSDTNLHLYEFKEVVQYTAKYIIRKIQDGHTFLYVGWTDEYEEIFANETAETDPRIMHYSVDVNGEIKNIPIRVKAIQTGIGGTYPLTPQEAVAIIGQLIENTSQITVVIEGQTVVIHTVVKDINNYINMTSQQEQIEVVIPESMVIDSQNPLIITLKKSIPSFSLYANTGRIETNYGQLGSFTFDKDKMKDGVFDGNVKFEITDINGNIVTKTLAELGKCFVEAHIWGGSDAKILYLKRLNGEEIRLPEQAGSTLGKYLLIDTISNRQKLTTILNQN